MKFLSNFSEEAI